MFIFQENVMKKTDPTVKKETVWLGLWVLTGCVLMHGVFLMIGRWSLSVLWGSLLGALGAVGNFYLLGRTVQSAVDRGQDRARTLLKLSQTYRLLALLVLVVVGVVLPCFQTVAVILPLFFPRLAFFIRGLSGKTN